MVQFEPLWLQEGPIVRPLGVTKGTRIEENVRARATQVARKTLQLRRFLQLILYYLL